MKLVSQNQVSAELKLVVDAINSIDEKYYAEPITRLQNGEIFSTGEYRANESTFVTQLTNKIETKFYERSIHIDKYYQTDQPKQLIFRNDSTFQKYRTSLETLFSPDELEFFKVPDIVIHSGPKDLNPENQIFLSEVKTTFNLTQHQFNIDLFKSNVYHEELHFQNTAFIIVNVKVGLVKDRFSVYRDSGFYKSKRRGIYLLVKPSHNDTVKIFEQ